MIEQLQIQQVLPTSAKLNIYIKIENKVFYDFQWGGTISVCRIQF